jgi:hypothetical protein
MTTSRSKSSRGTATRSRTGADQAKAPPSDAEYQRVLKLFGDRPPSSLRRAKWISSPEEHEDRKGQTLATRNHDVIRSWAEERGARPATVETSRSKGDTRTLRFDFPDFGGEGLKEISWDEWLRVFDERNLVFIYQEHMRNGSTSNFFQLVAPEREDG